MKFLEKNSEEICLPSGGHAGGHSGGHGGSTGGIPPPGRGLAAAVAKIHATPNKINDVIV